MFPPMVVQMIGIGEQTGALDEMLAKIADFYDDEVDAAVDALTAAIEPIMIVVMGAHGGRHAGRHVPAHVQDVQRRRRLGLDPGGGRRSAGADRRTAGGDRSEPAPAALARAPGDLPDRLVHLRALYGHRAHRRPRADRCAGSALHQPGRGLGGPGRRGADPAPAGGPAGGRRALPGAACAVQRRSLLGLSPALLRADHAGGAAPGRPRGAGRRGGRGRVHRRRALRPGPGLAGRGARLAPGLPAGLAPAGDQPAHGHLPGHRADRRRPGPAPAAAAGAAGGAWHRGHGRRSAQHPGQHPQRTVDRRRPGHRQPGQPHLLPHPRAGRGRDRRPRRARGHRRGTRTFGRCDPAGGARRRTPGPGRDHRAPARP